MKGISLSSTFKHVSSAKLNLIRKRLVFLYGLERADELLERLYQMIGRYGVGRNRTTTNSKSVSQKDAVLITYADMVSQPGEHTLSTLKDFCTSRLKGAFSAIHILPFYHHLH